jgi:hypothetical protein
MAYCVKCGKPYEDGAAFCPGCGVALRPGATAPPPTSAPVVPPPTAAPAASAPVKRGLFPSQRSMIVAIVAIVAVAAVAIAGFSFLGSAGLNGKALVAFASTYKGTWVDQQGNKAIIDTSGGTARISIIRGSDGSQVGSATIDGGTITVSGGNGEQMFSAKIDGDNISAGYSQNGAQMSLSKNVLVVKNPSSGETYTFVRH